MKYCAKQTSKALTLVEVLVAMAIVVIVAVIFLPVVKKLAGNTAGTKTSATLTTVNAALERYSECGKTLCNPAGSPNDGYEDYRFPIDCRDHANTAGDKWQEGVDNYLSLTDCEDILGVEITSFPAGLTASNEFSNVMLYIQLSMLPQCCEVLDGLSAASLVRKYKGVPMEPVIDGEPRAAFLIVDGWGTPLRYWYDGALTFPQLISAGPDKEFETDDDVFN